jgi:hypothetical protein
MGPGRQVGQNRTGVTFHNCREANARASDRRFGRKAHANVAGQTRPVHCRIYREMGQGDPRGQHQARLNPGLESIIRRILSTNVACGSFSTKVTVVNVLRTKGMA